MVSDGSSVLLVRKTSVLPDSKSFKADAAQMLWVMLCRVEAVEHDALIADDAAGTIYRSGIDTACIHALLGLGHEESARLAHRKQPLTVEIAAIHHVKISRLDGRNIQNVDIVQLVGTDVNKGRNRSAQI